MKAIKADAASVLAPLLKTFRMTGTCSGILSQDSNVKRGREKPKLTWVETIKGDLK